MIIASCICLTNLLSIMHVPSIRQLITGAEKKSSETDAEKKYFTAETHVGLGNNLN